MIAPKMLTNTNLKARFEKLLLVLQEQIVYVQVVFYMGIGQYDLFLPNSDLRWNRVPVADIGDQSIKKYYLFRTSRASQSSQSHAWSNLYSSYKTSFLHHKLNFDHHQFDFCSTQSPFRLLKKVQAFTSFCKISTPRLYYSVHWLLGYFLKCIQR